MEALKDNQIAWENAYSNILKECKHRNNYRCNHCGEINGKVKWVVKELMKI